MMFLQVGEATSGSRENQIIRASKPFIKDSGKQEGEMDSEHSFTITDADCKVLLIIILKMESAMLLMSMEKVIYKHLRMINQF